MYLVTFHHWIEKTMTEMDWISLIVPPTFIKMETGIQCVTLNVCKYLILFKRCIYFEKENRSKVNTFLCSSERDLKKSWIYVIFLISMHFNKCRCYIAIIHKLQMSQSTLHLISTSRVCFLRSFSWMACHMTPLPLFGSASPRNQRLLKSYKTKPEVEPEAQQHLALSCVWWRQMGGQWRTWHFTEDD